MLGIASRRGISYWLALVPSLAIVGCGGSSDGLPRQAVSGKVTFDGKPLESGTIRFVPSAPPGGGPQVEGGDTIKGGQFSISREVGLVPGSYKVSIYSGNLAGERPKANMGPGRAPAVAKELIPKEYNAMTKLTADIKEGANDLSFDLTSTSKEK